MIILCFQANDQHIQGVSTVSSPEDGGERILRPALALNSVRGWVGDGGCGIYSTPRSPAAPHLSCSSLVLAIRGIPGILHFFALKHSTFGAKKLIIYIGD